MLLAIEAVDTERHARARTGHGVIHLLMRGLAGVALLHLGPVRAGMKGAREIRMIAVAVRSSATPRSEARSEAFTYFIFSADMMACAISTGS